MSHQWGVVQHCHRFQISTLSPISAAPAAALATAPPPPCGLTAIQRDALLIIQELSAGGVAPTYDEIARELDIVKSNAHRVVARLVERGFVAFRKGSQRSIVVLRPIPMPDPEAAFWDRPVRTSFPATDAGDWP